MTTRTVGQLEDGPEWSRILARLESKSLHDVAREFGVTPGVVAAALVRSKTFRKAVIASGTQVAGDADPAPSSEPLAPPDPIATPVNFPAEPTAPVRSPGKLDAHVSGYRAAVEGGGGPAFLAQLHQLVRVNLRSRIAGSGDDDLLARFDQDLPPRSAVSSPTAAPGSRSTSSEPRPSPVTPTPKVLVPMFAPVPVVEAPEAIQQVLVDVAPPRTQVSHIYVLTVLLDGVERQYGVAAESMGAAIAIAVRATGTGEVLAATRGLPALV